VWHVGSIADPMRSAFLDGLNQMGGVGWEGAVGQWPVVRPGVDELVDSEVGVGCGYGVGSGSLEVGAARR
jgi:hypothetical protein